MNRKQRRAAGFAGAVDGQAVVELFSAGVAHHQQGRLAEAVAAYRRAVALAPNVAEFHNNLGLALKGLGRHSEAIQAFRKAIACNPGLAEAHNSLGNSLADLGRPAEAAEAFRRAIGLQPDLADPYSNLGSVLRDLGRQKEAEEACRSAIARSPRHAEAHNTLGTVLRDRGRREEAVAAYRQAIACDPGHPTAPGNLGAALRELGRLDEALAACTDAIALTPNSAEAHNTLGATLWDMGRPEAAAEAYRRAVTLAPRHAMAQANLGKVLRDLGRLEEAEVCCRRAVAAAPSTPHAHNALGMGLRDLGRFDEAARSFRRAIELDPGSAEGHANLGMLLLRQGNFAEGWSEYEWRWRADDLPRKDYLQPWWQGEDLAGRTLLLWAEQGLGDVIQFVRYAPILAARGAKVILEVYEPLTRLLANLPGGVAAIAWGSGPPPFDVHLPLMSVPYLLGTRLETIPAAVPYLRAEEAAAAIWYRRLSGLPGAKVGLVWAGNSSLGFSRGGAADRRRSIPLDRLVPLLRISGVTFVSLQKGEAASQIADLPPELRPLDFMDEVADLADTAALVAGLDLVISVDTAVAHLAGAMGKPLWLLSRFDGDWRWLVDRDDSPWYPTARIYRQRKAGDWAEVIARVVADLASYPGSPSP